MQIWRTKSASKAFLFSHSHYVSGKFLCASDTYSSTPAETMTENILATRVINSGFALMITEERLVDVARIFDECSADLKKIISHRKFTPLHEVLLGIDKSHKETSRLLPFVGPGFKNTNA